MSDTPPQWLAWTASTTTRGLTTLLAIVALVLAIVLGVRQQAYISCVGESQRADAVRTSAIAAATDRERAAQRELLAATDPADTAALRRAVLDAYDSTDRVRRDNPPAPVPSC